MKKYIPLIIVIFFLYACEEVIEVELETAPEKLVIDASIIWKHGTDGSFQYITLTKTAPYYDIDIPPANNATVYITSEDNNVFYFTENDNTGIYENHDFVPELLKKYTLTIIYENETYTAQETLLPSPVLNNTIQQTIEIFSEEYIELKTFFYDDENEVNFYYYKFEGLRDSSINVVDDELVNGKEIFAYFASNKLKVNDNIAISLFGISEQYYNYLFTLFSQTGNPAGPFETQPTSVRGNIINETNPENYPFGYFRLSQADKYNYIIE